MKNRAPTIFCGQLNRSTAKISHFAITPKSQKNLAQPFSKFFGLRSQNFAPTAEQGYGFRTQLRFQVAESFVCLSAKRIVGRFEICSRNVDLLKSLYFAFLERLMCVR